MNAVSRLLADPRATLHALDCLEARDDFLTFCGMIEIPSAPPPEEDPPAEEGSGDPDEEARVDIVGYRKPAKPTALHHLKLAKVLQAVADGEVKRAMFFLPPGSAKSTYASVVFPTWFMGRRKRKNVILATYGDSLARKMGRRARSVIKQGVYRRIFGTGLSGESSAADEWALLNGNEFMAGGIRSGMTGNRADLIIIDDPIKGREQAESETVRKRTLEAFQDDLLTRLKPHGAVLLIQTRWHEADLAGELLPEDYDGETGWVLCRDGEYWYVVCIPAQAERNDDPLGRKVGEYIWPEWFPKEHWDQFKNVLRTWAALFQQRPRPQEGTFFQEAWFRRYVPEQRPKAMSIYFTSDHAPGGKQDNDFNCLRVWGVDPEGDLWLLDGVREQCTMDVFADHVVGNIKDTHRDPERPLRDGLLRRYRPFAWFPEDDNSWKASAGFITRRMREEGLGCRIEPQTPNGADKATRALAFQGMASSRRVWLPVGPEGDAVLTEYLKFPLGKHDDEVDAAAVIGKVLDEAHPAIVKPERQVEARKRYGKAKKRTGWA